jgi:DNA repair protein RadC
MSTYHNEKLKRLISESLREKQGSYAIQELFQRFPKTAELLDVLEQQNTKNRLIFKEIISIGSLNAAIVHPR